MIKRYFVLFYFSVKTLSFHLKWKLINLADPHTLTEFRLFNVWIKIITIHHLCEAETNMFETVHIVSNLTFITQWHKNSYVSTRHRIIIRHVASYSLKSRLQFEIESTVLNRRYSIKLIIEFQIRGYNLKSRLKFEIEAELWTRDFSLKSRLDFEREAAIFLFTKYL